MEPGILRGDFPVELQIEAKLCQLEFLNRVLQKRGHALDETSKCYYLKKAEQLEQYIYQLRIRQTFDLISRTGE